MRIQNESLNPQNMNHVRFVRRFMMIGLAALLIGGGGLKISPAKADTWRGTAPFCSGECLSGEVEIQRSTTGNGGYCLTGSKVLCRNSEPTCQALQTNVACKGVVLICDNGFYTQTTNQPDWHSCSKYACGGCLGWWSDWKEPIVGTIGGLRDLSPLSVPSLPRGGSASLPNLPYGPDTCKSGYVWRGAIPNDHVCVVSESREQAKRDNKLHESRISPTDRARGSDTCKQGYVWREVVPSDHVCVTPQIREQTRIENSQFENNRAKGSLW